MHEELINELESLRQASGEVESTLSFVENQISELRIFSETIDKMNKSSDDEFYAPIGKGVFVKSKKLDKDLLVDAGAGVFVKKTIVETSALINNQISKLEEMRSNLNNELGKFAVELERIRKSLASQ